MPRNEDIPGQPRHIPGSELFKHARPVGLSGLSATIPDHRVHRVCGSGRTVLTNKCVYRRRFWMSSRTSRLIFGRGIATNQVTVLIPRAWLF